MKIGRNAPCPCNSGKKYKFCCEQTAARKDWSKVALVLTGLALLLGAVGMVTSIAGSDELDGLVWSAEHGHWHTADGREVGAAAGARALPPPGPAPEGKVWSPEHGHWHDAE
ncbi:MAG TPA: SEC-C metal-binding domain-containing protein [Vulgatibacter sp.]|nr:SEC-C metal-binding domain-containing protein [Vulgatibacter sp.]